MSSLILILCTQPKWAHEILWFSEIGKGGGKGTGKLKVKIDSRFLGTPSAHTAYVGAFIVLFQQGSD